MSAEQTTAEWAASLTVADVDVILGRCVAERDFQGLRVALHLMAVKDADRAVYWRDLLSLGVEVAKARHAAAESGDYSTPDTT